MNEYCRASDGRWAHVSTVAAANQAEALNIAAAAVAPPPAPMAERLAADAATRKEEEARVAAARKKTEEDIKARIKASRERRAARQSQRDDAGTSGIAAASLTGLTPTAAASTARPTDGGESWARGADGAWQSAKNQALELDG